MSSKEQRGLPNRAKDGYSGDEFNRDSVLRDERRLVELGWKTLEIYILGDIFSNRIQRAYREVDALKRREELIREEEATGQAENEKKEKRAKKKQAKQRRNNRKSKGGGNDEKSVGMMTENIQLNECPPDEQVWRGDVSDPGNDDDETLQPDVEYRDASQIHHTAEACSSQIPNVHAEKKSSYFVDDSSSTCSTDSVPLVVKGPYNGNISANPKNKRNSSRRGKKQQNQEKRNSSTSSAARLLNVSSSSSATEPEPKALICASEDQIKKLEQTFVKKSSEEEVYTTTGGKTIIKDQIDEEIPCNLMTKESSSSSTSPSRKTLIKTEKKRTGFHT